MKTKITFLLITLLLSTGVTVDAQKKFLKNFGNAVKKEITKEVKKSSQKSNKSSNKSSSKQRATTSKQKTRKPHPLTDKTYRNPTEIKVTEKTAKVVIEDIVYYINLNSYTASVLGALPEKKGELEEANIWESILYNDIVYPVTYIGSAFTGEPLYSTNIPYGIKGIGKNAYAGSLIESIVIPGSVEELSASCFSGTWVKTAILEEGVKKMEAFVFGLCEKLEEVQMPSTIEKMDRETFRGCKSLKKVIFAPNSQLKTIPVNTFWECKKLTYFDIPESVEEIGSYAFAYSGLTKVTIPENIKKIGENAFNETQLTEITIPSTVEEIGDYAFASCKKLKKINISKKFKDLAILAEIFGHDSTHIFTDIDLDKCKSFNWID